MTRWQLIIEYDGTTLKGLQRQQHLPTVQSLIEQAIFKFCGETITLQAAGRTDAGVHALAMSVHIDLARSSNSHEIMGALNAYLRGSPVVVLEVIKQNDDFHARFSATKRHYYYHILNRPAPSVLLKNRAWHVAFPLDIALMQRAADDLAGHHDFTSFRASECQAQSPVKTLDQLEIHAQGEHVKIYAAAKSFLHHQVRNMVGTLVEIGKHKRASDSIAEILNAKDRSKAGVTAPAHGLYFLKASYGDRQANHIKQ
ncbi:MAG: tRNA pseudouridine(38-40) synthase TruA [Alphaproteobacteria bacterium]